MYTCTSHLRTKYSVPTCTALSNIFLPLVILHCPIYYVHVQWSLVLVAIRLHLYAWHSKGWKSDTLTTMYNSLPLPITENITTIKKNFINSSTHSSPSDAAVISSTSFWGSRIPRFFCTTTMLILTPPGSFRGHSKWCASATSRCRMATISLLWIARKTKHTLYMCLAKLYIYIIYAWVQECTPEITDQFLTPHPLINLGGGFRI